MWGHFKERVVCGKTSVIEGKEIHGGGLWKCKSNSKKR